MILRLWTGLLFPLVVLCCCCCIIMHAKRYEADGIIFASSRMLTQRDVLFARHSHSFVMYHPTWPVEWQQASAFLGWQDYMWTGQPDLALAFLDTMHERTGIKYLEPATGLLDTSQMGSHIVDWMPQGAEADQTVERGEFTASKHMSVTNGWAAQGLRHLSVMAAAGGRAANATQFAGESAGLFAAMKAKMWNGSAYCDGGMYVCVCARVRVCVFVCL
jgi:alpha-L-rhamnosidase